MSKKAKEEQGYQEKPIQRTCSNCKNYSSLFVTNEFGYEEEKQKTCFLGGFAVKKMAVCNLHDFKIVE